MRLSEFWQAVTDEFGGPYGRVLVSDLVLSELGERTAADAIATGLDTRDVWLALCRASDVPRNRWHGVGLPEPKK
ncbi:MAG: hypothetical protein ACJAS7_000544 [Alpinimonas sp.]